MLRITRVATRCLTVVLAAGLILFVGCDLFGLIGERIESPSFRTTDDLAERISVLRNANDGSSALQIGEGNLSVVSAVQVQSPTVEGQVVEATNLSYNSTSQRLHVAYKMGGDPFGGAIDILSVRADRPVEDRLGGVQSLQSENVDVVEVNYDPGKEALYASGGIRTRKDGVSPAIITRLDLEASSVEVRDRRLSHFVGKSLVLGPSSNTIHVATDENALYQFDAELENQVRIAVDDAAGFRSIAKQDGNVFVLDRSGRVFTVEPSVFEKLSEVASLSDSEFSEGTIARLHSIENRFYAALNEKGFSIFTPAGESVWTSEGISGQRLYTSVAVTSEHLYVGRSDGTIEIYRRPDEVPLAGEGLDRVDTLRLWGTVPGDLQTASINQMLALDGVLYVAYSTEGLIAVEIDTGSASN